MIEVALVSSQESADVVASTQGSAQITLGHSADFADGDDVVVERGGALPTLSTPPAPTAVYYGVASGSHTHRYRVCSIDEDLGVTACSGEAVVGGLPHTSELSPDSYVLVTPAHDPEAYQYGLWRQIDSGPWEFLRGLAANSEETLAGITVEWRDGHENNKSSNALKAAGKLPVSFGVPNGTYPSEPIPRILRTTIASGGGTTSLTLADPVLSESPRKLRHDNGRALQAAIDAAPNGRRLLIGLGYFEIWQNIRIADKRISLVGEDDQESQLRFVPGFNFTIRGSAARGTKLADLAIRTTLEAWSLPAGSWMAGPIQQGHADVQRWHGCGLVLQSPDVYLDGVRVQGVSGSGIAVFGRGKEGTNANRCLGIRCNVVSNRGHGLYLSGNESNASTWIHLNRYNNLGFGILNSSFLGIAAVSGHSSSNEYGAIVDHDDTAFNTYLGEYREGGEKPPLTNNRTITVGGDHGSGIDGTGFSITGASNMRPHTVYSDNGVMQISYGKKGEPISRTIYHEAHQSPGGIQYQAVDVRETISGDELIHYADGFQIGRTLYRERPRHPRYGVHFPRRVSLGDPGHAECDVVGGNNLDVAWPIQDQIHHMRNRDMAGEWPAGSLMVGARENGVYRLAIAAHHFGVGVDWSPNAQLYVGAVRYPTTANGCAYVADRFTDPTIPRARTASTEPLWPTAEDAEVTDNKIVWRCLGPGSDTPGWTVI